MKRSIVFLFAIVACCAGCSNDYIELSAGRTGRLLHPKGWDTAVQLPGMVDVGIKNNDGSYSRLVTIDSGSMTIKEEFNITNGQDHRLVLANQIPVSCEVYIQVIAPDPIQDRAQYDLCYTLVEPKTISERLSHIDINEIYERFAKQHVRGGIRGVALQYVDFNKFSAANAIAKDKQISEFNEIVAVLVAKVFKDNNVPLRITGVTPSNIKQDQAMIDAVVQNQAVKDQVEREATRIERVGAALRQNPESLQMLIWDKLGEVLEKGKSTGNTFIIDLGNMQPKGEIKQGVVAAQLIKKAETTK